MGGGVYVAMNGIFTINDDGVISGNSSTEAGGGVYVIYSGRFTMAGGVISGNSAYSDGGGVYLEPFSIFAKTNGTIYGYNAEDIENRNTAARGQAVHSDGKGSKDTTLGPGDNLTHNHALGDFFGWD
jgi:hypothetical protein